MRFSKAQRTHPYNNDDDDDNNYNRSNSYTNTALGCAIPDLKDSPRAFKNTDQVDVTMNELSSASIDSDDVRSTAYLFQRVGQGRRRKYRVVLSVVSTMTLLATAIALISVTIQKMNNNNKSTPTISDNIWSDQPPRDSNGIPLFPRPPVFNNIGVTTPPAMAPHFGNDNNNNDQGQGGGNKNDQDNNGPLFSFPTTITVQTPAASPSSDEEEEVLGFVEDDDTLLEDESTTTTTTTTTPTMNPTATTTASPSQVPTIMPSRNPSSSPSVAPTTDMPTVQPVMPVPNDDDEWVYQDLPTSEPPTAKPTRDMTEYQNPPPTSPPTKAPTQTPTAAPTRTRRTFAPSKTPTKAPIASTIAPVVTTTPPKPTFNVLDLIVDDDDTLNMDSSITYRPGDLVREEAGLKLSAGLTARILAYSDQLVEYDNGQTSQRAFHGRPDAGDTFRDTRDWNQGGWIYLSNSEMRKQDPPGGMFRGGVGALTFDKDGKLIEYDMVLDGSTHNCGGGRTPWNTWVSCEETGPPHGKIWQVDPFGERPPQLMTVGSEGGAWESFAYDITDYTKPRFFVTEDTQRGAVQRFTPENPDWRKPWTMLHGNGTTEYLVLTPDSTGNAGTYEWTDRRVQGRKSAMDVYPNCEGIDSDGESLFFVSKRLQVLFTLDLRGNTYTKTSTVRGMFDGRPDQIIHNLNRDREQYDDDLLYFTEEGGKDAGIHGRGTDGRYFTILEGIDYKKETTGLAFSPDNRFLYLAFQENGILFEVKRMDGLSFHAASLNIKYHAQQ